MIYAKTEAGQKVMKDRSVPLTGRQRSAFILIDGRRTLDEVLKATAAVGVTPEDITQLAALGLIYDLAPQVTAAEQAAQQATEAAVQRHKQRSSQERYAEAYPIAAGLTASLGLRGFRLNLAVEAATNYEALVALAPKIREAVGPEKYKPLDDALNDR
jgi:hypothetical protein